MIAYRVMLCCNDDRGNATGRVSELEVGDEIRIACTGNPPTMRLSAGSVKIGRVSYACRDHSTWVGNICWDAVTMDMDTVSLLLAALLKGDWAVEEYAEDGPFAKLAKEAA